MILLLVFVSCGKERKCAKLEAPVASSNSPVNYDATLKLKATDIEDVDYIWTGPNDFTSKLQNPELSKVTSDFEGEYTVKVVQNKCTSELAKTYVAVNPPMPPCNPALNTAKIESMQNSMNFSIVNGKEIGSNQYEVIANSSNGDVRIIFDAKTPKEGRYDLVGTTSSFDMRGTKARLSITAASSFWQTSGDYIYVKIVEGKLNITFCDLMFSESTFGTKSKASGNIQEK
jgi:hypothetical protein